MELAFLPEEAEYTDSTERVLVASVISVTQNQLFLWILPTYPGTAEVTETANSAVSVTSAASDVNVSLICQLWLRLVQGLPRRLLKLPWFS